LNAVYARALVENGYQVDCSVTPHQSWAEHLGDPRGAGGPDFTRFPELPYLVDLDQIDRPGDSPLLEVPVSVIETRHARLDRQMQSCPKWLRRISRRFCPPVLSMVPRDNRRSFSRMHAILRHAIDRRWPCVLMATHSSELMPGGSPFFPTAASIERLYRRLETLFSRAATELNGMTLNDFRNSFGPR
jgi:hypothetical protein